MHNSKETEIPNDEGETNPVDDNSDEIPMGPIDPSEYQSNSMRFNKSRVIGNLSKRFNEHGEHSVLTKQNRKTYVKHMKTRLTEPTPKKQRTDLSDLLKMKMA